MGISVPNPPRESFEVCKTGLKDVFGGGSEAPLALAGAHPEEFKFIYPHKVFALALDDLAGGAGLEKAKLIGWRYLMSRHNIIAASVDVTCDPNGRNHCFAGVNEGPFNGATQETVIAASQKDLIKKGSYELSVLRIRELYVMALWLRDLNGANDVIVPLHPTHDSLQAGKAYSRSQFLRVMSEAAAEEQLGFTL